MKLGTLDDGKRRLRVNAFKWPNKIGDQGLVQGSRRSNSGMRDRAGWPMRSADLGMKKGDRFAVLAYNCVEWMEIYVAAAKGGFICVPLMFRLAPVEMEYIINHCEAKVFIVQGGTDKDGKEYPWIKMVAEMKKNIPTVEKYISFAVDNPQLRRFHLLMKMPWQQASPEEPDTKVDADDIWVIMYTGGTTGKPKGVMKIPCVTLRTVLHHDL